MTDKKVTELNDENYKTILNSMGDPVFVKDFQSRLVLVNDAFCKVFGRSRAEIIGKTLAEDVLPEERDGFLKVDKQVISTGKESIVEESLTIRGGTPRIISTRKTRFIDKMGNKFLVGIIRDVTDHKEAEELSRLNEYNEFLLNAAQILSKPDANYKTALTELAKEVSLYLNVVCDISILDSDTEIIRPEALYYSDKEIENIIRSLFASVSLKKGQGMVGAVIATGKEILMVDVDERMKAGPRSVDPRIAPRSLMYVPLSGASTVLGSLNLTRLEGQEPFTVTETNQIRRLGDYLSLFVENSLLKQKQLVETELRIVAENQLEQEKNWANFKIEVSTILADVDVDLTTILQLFAKKVSDKFNVVCDIQIADKDRKSILMVALHHRSKEVRETIMENVRLSKLEVGHGLIGNVFATGKEYVMLEFSEEFRKKVKQKKALEVTPTSVAYLPLKGHQEVMGTLDVTRIQSQPQLTMLEVNQIRDLADHAAQFIENRLLQIRQKQEIKLRIKAEQKYERAGRVLERMEAETRSILNAIPIYIAKISKDHRYLFLNEAYRNMGIDPRKMEGRYVKDILGETALESVQPFFDQALAGQTVTYDYNGVMADGIHRYFNVALAPDYSQSGEVVGFYSCASDVTSKVLAEKATKLTQDRLDTLSMNSGDAFFFHDGRQRIMDVNQVATDMLGFTREEFLTMEASQIDPRWKGKVYQKFLDNLDVNQPQTFDTLVFRKDGTEIPVEVRFVKRLEGDQVFIQSLIRDRTEKREQELKLQRSEERLRLIFENVEDIISVHDEEGIFESVNKATQGHSEEDVIGSSLFDLYDKQKASEVRLKYENLKKTGESFILEESYVGPDGTAILYWVKFVAIFHDGKFFKAIVITRDVTAEKSNERSEMNAVLRGQEQERKRLGAELHDGIGQVLSAIALQVSQINEEIDEKDFKRVKADMQELTAKLHAAIREVRNISHNLMPEVLESFGLKEALNQTCNHLRDRAGINVRFNHVDLEDRYAPLLEVNLFRITQELLNNIQKHAKCNNVFVNLMDHGDSLDLTVEDDGVGFEKESTSDGIGLSNVYSRVNMMSGQIDVESDKNSGTLINIEVPKKIE